MPQNKAAWLSAPKSVPLEVSDAPITDPKEGQILIQNSAVALNPVDVAIQYVSIFPVNYPAVLGTDVAGTVAAVGPGVTRFKPGDRVLGYASMLAKKENEQGAFQLYTVVPADVASAIPDDLPFEKAAVLPLALATTSWALFSDATLSLKYPKLAPEPTDHVVLIWGGSSSVGGTAVQLAKAAGYQVLTTASPKNHDYVKGLGADHVLDYKSPSVIQDMISIVKGKRFAGAFEASGSEDGMSGSVKVASEAEGNRKVICVRGYTGDKPEGVTVKTILSTSIVGTEVAEAVFEKYVPAALKQGKLKAAPEPEIVGRGLESIQQGINALAKGVSAKKLVVTL